MGANIGRLAGVLQPFGRLIVTPPVLAEVSNLGDRIDGFLAFLTVVLPTAPFEERCVTMPDVLAASGFSRLGFTDSTVERLGAEGHLVITDDFPLYRHLFGRQIDVINFNHLRTTGE